MNKISVYLSTHVICWKEVNDVGIDKNYGRHLVLNNYQLIQKVSFY